MAEKKEPCISKETFCKALSLIKEQTIIDEKFSDALSTVGNGHFAFGADNKYLEGLLLVLTEVVGDKYGYISWWLYDTNDYHVWERDVREPEDIYK